MTRRDSAPGPVDTAIAELLRRKEQRRVAAADLATHDETRHETAADTYDAVIDVLRQIRDAHTAAAADTPETGVRVDANELVIVEATDAGHRRRTYRAAPATPVDARLEVDRWHADGWRPVGEETVAQLVVNGERIFE